MTRYLSRRQIEDLHQKALAAHGGAPGIHNESGLESTLVQPQMTFGGQSLYPTLHEKACALAFSLIMNHPFVDGNKRVAHLAMVVFLMANGYELSGDIDDHERTILSVASGEMPRDQFAAWVEEHLIRLSDIDRR
jgi:death-on-curing protein